MSNKFKYDKGKKELWLDVDPPDYFIYQVESDYHEDLSKWEARLHYPVSDELAALLKDGQVIGENEFATRNARTWTERNGEYGCDECCNRDRCDEDCTATYYRPNCPYCKGKGWLKEIPIIAIPLPEQTNKVKERLFTLEEMLACWEAGAEWYEDNEDKLRFGKRSSIQPKDKEQYFKESFNIDIKNNQPNE